MTATNHYQVSVEQADGLYDLEYNNNGGEQEDFFYQGASHKNSFDPNTSPDSKWWDGTSSNLYIENINATGTQFTLYPAPPANFSITNRSGLTVEYSWNSVGSGTRYAVYRKYHGTTDDPVKLTETTNTTVVADTLYGLWDYYVAIVDSDGNRLSYFSSSVTVDAFLQAPTNLVKRNQVGSNVIFGWDSITQTDVYGIYMRASGSTDVPTFIAQSLSSTIGGAFIKFL